MPVPTCGNGRARAQRPRARRSPLEVRVHPRAGRSPLEGGVCPRARRSLLEGIFEWAALVGRGSYRGVGRALCVRLSKMCLSLVFCRFQAGFPHLFKGTPGLSPTVAPEHLRVRQLGSRRCWSLLIGRPSPLVRERFPWGRVSGPAGLAPEALQERECSCRGFTAGFGQRAWYIFQPASAMFQPASVTHAQLPLSAAGAIQEV
jgi:hypothetical protein